MPTSVPDRSLTRKFFNHYRRWMSVCVLTGYCLGAAADVACGAPVAKIIPVDGVDGDWFGGRVALDANTLVVGSQWHPGAVGRGAAYVYRRNGSDWNFMSQLSASDGQGAANFGNSVGVDGGTIIVGDYQHSILTPSSVRSAGAAYVFGESAGSWIETAKLTSIDPTNEDQFGSAVAIRGGEAIVGNGGDAGAYSFEKLGESWVFSQKLTPSVPDGFGLNGSFGNSLAMGDGFVLIGASSQDAGSINSGAVFSFQQDASSYVETHIVTPSDPIWRGSFGRSIDVDGDIAIIGRPNGVPTTTPVPGAAYIFQRIGEEWMQVAKLQASDGMDLDFFGSRVALSGDLAAVSAFGRSEGKVYVFQRDNGIWRELLQLTSGESFDSDQFGVDLALAGNLLAVGARLDDEGGTNVGAVYLYAVPEPGAAALCLCGFGFLAGATCRWRCQRDMARRSHMHHESRVSKGVRNLYRGL